MSGRISGGQLCELHETRGLTSSMVAPMQTHCKQLPTSCGRTAPTAYDMPGNGETKADNIHTLNITIICLLHCNTGDVVVDVFGACVCKRVVPSEFTDNLPTLFISFRIGSDSACEIPINPHKLYTEAMR